MRLPPDHNGVLYLRTSPPVLRLNRRGPEAEGEDTGWGRGPRQTGVSHFSWGPAEVRGHLPRRPDQRKGRPASFRLTLTKVFLSPPRRCGRSEAPRPSFAFYLNLPPRLSAACFHLGVQVEGGSARAPLSLTCAVSPCNNGALHHITRRL